MRRTTHVGGAVMIIPMPKVSAFRAQAAQVHHPDYFPFFLTLLRTGCRHREAIALQPGDLDFRNRLVEFRRNFTNGRLTTPKNGKS